jgi:dTDP-D-glucose 4,6-dehydratase
VTKARDLLGWCPEISAEEGVRRTVEWFGGRLDEVRAARAVPPAPTSIP